MKEKKERKKYCLLKGLNPRHSGTQENRGKLAQFAAKKYSSERR